MNKNDKKKTKRVKRGALVDFTAFFPDAKNNLEGVVYTFFFILCLLAVPFVALWRLFINLLKWIGAGIFELVDALLDMGESYIKLSRSFFRKVGFPFELFLLAAVIIAVIVIAITYGLFILFGMFGVILEDLIMNR